MAGQPGRLLLPWMVAALCSALHPAASRAQLPTGLSGGIAQLEREAAELSRAPLPAVTAQPPGPRGSAVALARLSEGRRMLALRDFGHACVLLRDVVEHYPDHPVYPEALFLWSEAAFGAGDWLGARTGYRAVVERAAQPSYRAFLQRALARSIEIGLRTGDLRSAQEDLARMSQLGPGRIDGALHYLRGKLLYALASGEGSEDGRRAPADDPRWLQARAEFSAVEQAHPDSLVASYFGGVVDVLRGAKASALEVFGRVARVQARDERQARVVELARLALGRLYYEDDATARAADAYRSIPSSSSLFDAASYELAWVYLRNGDSTRAERALELLDVAAPRSLQLPDAKLLRANLLLRDGRFAEATREFGDTLAEFGPVRDDLDRMLSEHDDALQYFRGLVRTNLDVFDAASFLPASARPWVAAEGAMRPALGALDELSQTRAHVRETEVLAARLAAALAVPNPVALFADLRGLAQRAAALRNRVGQLRGELHAHALAAAKPAGGELQALRAQRAEIERKLVSTPSTSAALERRTSDTHARYDQLRAVLSRLRVELAGMDARIAATERFIAERRRQPSADSVASVRAELDEQRRALAEFRRRLSQLSLRSEVGRLQTGPGDSNAIVDRELRDAHAAVVARESQLLLQQGERLPQPASAEFARLAAVEAQLDGFDAQLSLRAAPRVAALQAALAEERTKLDQYRAQLAELELRSEAVVGDVAHDHYLRVRRRFYDLVLRADVGIVDVAWAVRENYRLRGELLSRERVRELGTLDDEYREIAEPSGGEP